MGAGDGTVIGITKVVDHGSPADRFNLVLVAEGFQSFELSAFATLVNQFTTYMFSMDPFMAYADAFNVYRLDVASDDSGADDPVACGGTGATVDTYFDASYCNGGIRRLLTCDSTLAINTVDALLPEWHQIVVVVNSTIWGGSGGAIATSCIAGGWENVIIHELGHAAFGLADEYEYWAGCGADVGHDTYTGGEPSAPNVTANTDRATIKWGDLILPTTPLPTTSNGDCSQCDPQPNPYPPDTVGAYEGAQYYHCGLYRPQFNCMMRNLSAFCAVCRRQIINTLEPYMPDIFPGHHWFEEFFDFRETHIIIPRWILVAYLIINWRMKDLEERINIKPSREFYSTVTKHLGAYIVKDVMPPEEIAGAILNMADDYMANRPMNLRAGDYIQIQNFMRQNR
jgi:hypothetical protein